MRVKTNYMYFGKGKDRIKLTHLSRPWKLGLVGYITSNLFDGMIPLKIVDSNLGNITIDLAGLGLNSKSNTAFIALDEEIFYGIKRGSKMARFILLHEVGHFFHRNDNEKMSLSPDDKDKLREEAVRNGSVLKDELDADSFAASYLGKDALEGIQELKRRMQEQIEQIEIQYGDECEHNGDIAIKEIELRISTLKELAMS